MTKRLEVTARREACYLQVSPYQADDGQKVGKLPSKLSKSDLKALGHPEIPIKAIRAKCVNCCGGDMSEARKCVSTSCPLWPMRMGRNPFHGQAA